MESPRTLNFLESSLKEKQSIINELRAFNDQLVESYEQLEHKYHTLNQQLKNLHHELSDKEEEIYQLNQKRHYQQGELKSFVKEKAHLDDVIVNTEKQVNLLLEENDALKADIETMRSEFAEQLDYKEKEYKEVLHQLTKQQQVINKMFEEQELYDQNLEEKLKEIDQAKEDEIKLRVDAYKKKDQQRLDALQDKIDALMNQQIHNDIKRDQLPSKYTKAIKFAERVRSMVAVCVDDEHLDDLGLVWKLLKTILNEYSKLKKNQKA